MAVVQPLADKKRITLDASSRAGDLTHPGDSARVKQILYNLLLQRGEVYARKAGE